MPLKSAIFGKNPHFLKLNFSNNTMEHVRGLAEMKIFNLNLSNIFIILKVKDFHYH